MSPDRDPGRLGDDGQEMDEHEDESPRSIFSALWFRALLAVLVLGVLAAIAVPYVLDFATTPAKPSAVAPVGPVTTAPAEPEPATPAATAPAPAVTAPSSAAPTSSVTPRAKPEAPPTPIAKSTTTKPAATKSTTAVAKAVETPKPPTKATEAAKPKAAAATEPRPAKAASGVSRGPYWVQVGAFKDGETAKRLAARLREQGLGVEESTTTAEAPRSSTPPAPAQDRYDVVVSGASAADVEAKLAAKGLKGETTAGGVVVRPNLALREAVVLSRDLADAGLSVQVRRVGGPAQAPAPASTVSPAGGPTLHRVRVGGFPDRAAAVDAMKRLEDKGFKPLIARGSE